MMIEVALRASVVLATAWLLVRLMPRASSATRHLVWHLALLATLALAPLALVPHVPKMPIMPEMLVPQVAHVVHVPEVTPEPQIPLVPQSESGIPGTLRTLGTLGTFAVLSWFAVGWIRAARLTRLAIPAPLPWQLELNALRDRLHVTQEVRLGIVHDQTTPLATGLWRSAILLPPASEAWSAERRRAVLIHELAHIRRRDCRVQAIAQAACALYWFNPLVWMAAARLRAERERACDDEVLRLGARASSYAAHLLEIARDLRVTLRPSAALAMARPSDLEGRLVAVLAPARARSPRAGTRWGVAAALTLTTFVAVMASTTPPDHGANATPRIAGEPLFRIDEALRKEAERSQARRERTAAKDTLETSEDSQDRELAVLSLAFSSGRDVIPALLQALSDDDAQVREKAAIGLALRRDERVVAPLIGAMADPDAQVREKAAIALGSSGDTRAIEVLTRALRDPDAQVREKAAAGLILHGLTASH